MVCRTLVDPPERTITKVFTHLPPEKHSLSIVVEGGVFEEYQRLPEHLKKKIGATSILLLLVSLISVPEGKDIVTRTLTLSSATSAFWSSMFSALFAFQHQGMSEAWIKMTAQEEPNRRILSIPKVLALPAAWLAWSLVMFTSAACWVLGTTYLTPSFDSTFSSTTEFALRASTTALNGIGLLSFILTVISSGRTYNGP